MSALSVARGKLECTRLLLLFCHLLFLRIYLHYSIRFLIYAHPIHGFSKSQDLLLNLLLTLVKLSIYQTKKKIVTGET